MKRIIPARSGRMLTIPIFLMMISAVVMAYEPGHPRSVPFGVSMLLWKDSTPGIRGYTDSISELAPHGVRLFGMAPEWSELEPAPGDYRFQDAVINPLTLLDPDGSVFRSYILVLKIIDTMRKTVPDDLRPLPFDDPKVFRRFRGLIRALSRIDQIRKVSHVLIGNEVDAYLGSRPDDLRAYHKFYRNAVKMIHDRLPGVRVGTIITFDSLLQRPGVADALLPVGDFICYTYYPAGPEWRMRPPSDITNDLPLMVRRAGEKPIAFSEIGYSSSRDNGSSEVRQAEFVRRMFSALRPVRDSGRLEFVFYHGLYDYPDAFSRDYALSQDLDSRSLVAFMNSLGLRSYETGRPKAAWAEFIRNLDGW